jgi:hypothetical protein
VIRQHPKAADYANAMRPNLLSVTRYFRGAVQHGLFGLRFVSLSSLLQVQTWSPETIYPRNPASVATAIDRPSRVLSLNIPPVTITSAG